MQSSRSFLFLSVLFILGLLGCDSGRHVDEPPPAVSSNGTVTEVAAAVLSNPITTENARPGSAGWRFKKMSLNREIDAYASTTSVGPLETFDLFVHVSTAQNVRWEAYRRGYYNGLGGRLIASGSANAAPQPACPVNKTTGLIECAWTRTLRITPNLNWMTGLYLIKLIRADGWETVVPMTVREFISRAPMVVQASVTTWQAYNAWGGASLYVNNQAVTGFVGPRATRVSFDRPLGLVHLAEEEPYMAEWLERRGYDVAYVTNIDVDTRPQLLDRRKLFLSVGHDEYWSVGERDAVERARGQGVSIAFFSANTAFWRIRLEPSSRGISRRIVTCYKGATLDPLKNDPQTTAQFRDPPFARPENALLGVMYELWAIVDGFPLIVTNPTHWIYAGTGVKQGETLANVVGYEWDRRFANGVEPAGLVELATSPSIDVNGRQGPHHMTIYHPTSSSFVFGSGTIRWSWALVKPGYVDARIQRITENLIARAGVPSPTPTTVPTLGPAVAPGQARSVRLVAGSGTAGYRDGVGANAAFNYPAGIAVAPDGTLYVTESRNHRVRKIAPNGTVSTVAGCGPTDFTSGGYKNGTGTAACFNAPSGIVYHPSGTLYVSDTMSFAVRAISPTGVVSTYMSVQKPRGLALGPDGALYVVDGVAHAVKRIAPATATTPPTLSTVATGFSYPTGLTAGPDGSLYVTETNPPRVRKIPRLNATLPPVFGTPQLVAGGKFGDQDGPGASAAMRPDDGIALLAGALVFSDTSNYRVRRIDLASPAKTVTNLVGDGRFGLGTLGTGATTRVVLPRGIAAFGNRLYLLDSGNHRVLVVEP